MVRIEFRMPSKSEYCTNLQYPCQMPQRIQSGLMLGRLPFPFYFHEEDEWILIRSRVDIFHRPLSHISKEKRGYATLSFYPYNGFVDCLLWLCPKGSGLGYFRDSWSSCFSDASELLPSRVGHFVATGENFRSIGFWLWM